MYYLILKRPWGLFLFKSDKLFKRFRRILIHFHEWRMVKEYIYHCISKGKKHIAYQAW